MNAIQEGERQSGLDVRVANVMAVKSVSNILRSSLGPQGLDKMLVDNIGDVVISNDGATILKTLEIQHPAAKVLVDLSQLQDSEVGDGTTTVVLIASALLQNALTLVKQDIHPTAIIAAYRLAMKESVRYIKANLAYTPSQSSLSKSLLSLATTTLSSKLIGPDSQIFAQIVVDAVQLVKTPGPTPRYPVNAINVLTTHGQSFKQSFLVDGYVLKEGRAAQGMPVSIKDAKIAIIDFNLRHQRLHLGVAVNITDPEELERVRLRERDLAKEKVQKILDAGANVLITTQGIDDMCLKYFVENKCIALRRIDKKDALRIAKATQATLVHNMAGEDGEETFSSSDLGACDLVFEERVGDWDHMFFQGCKGKRACSIILRGANEFMLEEAERSVHDAICAVSRALESNSLCAGGGTVETALCIFLEDFARTLGPRQQLAVAAFADALLTIPKTLALNAAYDASALVAKLKAYHVKSQEKSKEPVAASPTNAATPAQSADSLTQHSQKKYATYGLDLQNGVVHDALAAGILEPAIGKIKSLKFATEAAITILRIDDTIKTSQQQQQ